MNIKEISKRNYDATVRRGQINENTMVRDFILKISEETRELKQSWLDIYHKNHSDNFDPKELADITLVCFAMAEYYGIDLVAVMESKTHFNEQRKD